LIFKIMARVEFKQDIPEEWLVELEKASETPFQAHVRAPNMFLPTGEFVVRDGQEIQLFLKIREDCPGGDAEDVQYSQEIISGNCSGCGRLGVWNENTGSWEL
jgi:hypothetical protein